MTRLELSADDLSVAMEKAFALAKDFWATLPERGSYHGTTGEETTRLFSRGWGEAGLGAAVFDDFTAIADRSRPPGGKFFGYVLGSNEQVGAIAEFLAATLHQNVTAWRSGPAAVAVERTVVGWLANAVGCAGFSGSLCGGGSAANLMGLAMAREAKAPANEDGVREECVVYASDQVHMSIDKAVALLGLGHRNLRLIASDSQFRMQPEALAAATAADRAAGKRPIAVVASAGTVSMGAIDPLREIAAIAKANDLWIHVDGAYGALAALARPDLFEGLALADSLSLDAHKWLYQPLDCGCLLFRDANVARAAFSHNGDYVKVTNTDAVEAFAFFDESLELSRRFRALKLWMSLQYHGRAAFRDAIAQDLRHARLLEELVRAEPDLELLAAGPLSAVCFRHRSTDNEAVLKCVIERGRVYISNANIRGAFALRACFVNNRAREEDVRAIVSEVLEAAK
ncbi:MAG: pyridoxal-dependent decarboxylase [Proteobacteria bacterium]|nr:pyridoxal-dependent decarboxylase [Pseudomonadota bacterium]